jgi:alkylresorcinol/alkylpyrone synthase
MTATTYFTSANQAARHARGAPRIAGTAVAFTPHRHNQDEVARELAEFAGPGFMRFAQTAGVDHRSLAPTLSRYPKLTGFTEANNA